MVDKHVSTSLSSIFSHHFTHFLPQAGPAVNARKRAAVLTTCVQANCEAPELPAHAAYWG
jgi:hypothetical protein